jgi:hypothetical protein
MGPLFSFSRNFLASLLVVMFGHLLDQNELDDVSPISGFVLLDGINHTKAFAESNRSLTDPLALQRFVVIARDLADFFKSVLSPRK